MSIWKNVLHDPFGDTSCGIPDDRTLLSGKVKTRTTYAFIPVAQSGSPLNTNSSAMIVRPRPWYHIMRCAQTTSGTTSITDLNSAGTGFDNTSNATGASGFWPYNGAAMVRCVAIGVTITYLGTELNRAGRITAGLIPASKQAVTKAGAAGLSCLSTMVPTDAISGAADINDLRSAMQLAHTQRVGDEDLKLVWKPAGTPSYQEVTTAPGKVSTTDGFSNECEFFHNPGQNGQAAGEMNLVVLVENDYVTTAATAGNTYQVRVDAHWEIVPSSQYGVVYPLTPSPFSYIQLQDALNSIDRSTVLASTIVKPFRYPRKGVAPKQRKAAQRAMVQASTPSNRVKAAVETAKIAALLGIGSAAALGATKVYHKAIGATPIRPNPSRRIRDEL